MRASIAAERAGIPAVALVGRHYEEMSNLTARFLGFEGLGLAVYPGNIDLDSFEEFDAKVEASVCDQVVDRLLHAEPRPVPGAGEPAPREIVFRGTFDEVNDHFEAQGWTDGLPVRPPTVDRIEEFLSYTRREPGEVLGVLHPEGRAVTPWNVAVTGLMAGCRPEYMPVLIAVARAISDPTFKSEDGGSGTGWEPLIILSGPAIEQYDFNSGTGAMRVGRRANTSIGRFAKLLMINLAGQRIPPGTTDKTGVGTSFHVVLAEDEGAVRALGWPTFGDDRGIPAGRSGVTVQSVIGVSPPMFYGRLPHNDPFSYLEVVVDVFGKGICGYWVFTGLKFPNWHPTLVLSQEVAKMLADRGWTKDDIRRYVHDRSTVRAGDLLARGKGMTLDIERQVKAGLIPDTYLRSSDPDRLVSTIVRPEWLKIVVAGNPHGPVQQGYMNNHAQGIPVTKLIDD
jgi:hypothetical protein